MNKREWHMILLGNGKAEVWFENQQLTVNGEYAFTKAIVRELKDLYRLRMLTGQPMKELC